VHGAEALIYRRSPTTMAGASVVGIHRLGTVR
jgi:hypothetical protein